jgi:outer membrane protein TolC
VAQIVPTETPVLSDDPVNLDAAMKDAMQFRPELSRLRLQKEINRIDVDYFRNQTKPRIDLVSTFSLDGLALGNVNTNSFTAPLFDPTVPSTNAYFYNLICGASNPNRPPGCNEPIPNVVFPGTPGFYKGGFNRSFANLFRSDAPNFTVGVTFSFPLRNQTAKADLASARMESERIDAQTRSQEQAVIAEVRNAVQAVETARQRISTARRARENAEIQLEGERKLFEVGRSTTFFLFQRENALTNARNAEIRAETDYNKALSELQRVTSTTFRVNNIQVNSPVDEQ